MIQSASSCRTTFEFERTPVLGCILLWYPLFTQPFIFREIESLKEWLPLRVYSLYGRNARKWSGEMHDCTTTIRRFGLSSLLLILCNLLREIFLHPLRFIRLCKSHLAYHWPNLEIFAENLWAFCVAFSLARCLRRDRVDLLYAPWPRGTATAAMVASALTGIPFVIVARGDNLEPADPDLADKFSAALFVRANNAADKKRIENFACGLANGKTDLVYNCLTLPRTDAVQRHEASTSGHTHFLALGRFDVTKGFDILLKACAILRAEGLPFSLTLAGGGGRVMGLGALEDKLRELRSNLSLEEIVSMPGLINHNDLPKLLAAHDIFCAPCVVSASGKRDGIPNTVIEAMSSGMPVIGSALHALPEVIRDHVTGLTVAPGDPHALAKAMAWLALHPGDAMAMGQNAARLTHELFDPRTNSRRLATLFSEHYGRFYQNVWHSRRLRV